MSLLLKNIRYLVSQNESRDVFQGVDIKVEGDRIAEIAKCLSSQDAEEVIDCSDCLVMPGLVNTHTHISMTKLRGVADDVPLEDFLEKTFEIDSKLGEKDVYEGALLGCLESISFGTTSFNDLYYYEDEIARAAIETGIRANLAWASLDKEMTTQKGDPIKNCDSFIKRWKGKNPLIVPEVGIQGVYVVTEETYLRAKDISEKHDVKLHTHLSETRKEVYDCVKREGKRPVEWLDEMGLLSERMTAAHCVWLTKPEMDRLARKGVSVSHNPISNLKLASGGLCPVPELLERSAKVCLGTDGCASNNNLDLFEEMKMAAILHKNAKWDARVVSAGEALDMATINGAKSLGLDCGSIEEGKLADVLIINLKKANMCPVRDIISNIVYSMKGGDVDTSIIGGKVVMRDREIEGRDKIFDKLKTWNR